MGQLTSAEVEQVDDYVSELQAAVNHEALGQIGEYHLINACMIIFLLSSVPAWREGLCALGNFFFFYFNLTIIDQIYSTFYIQIYMIRCLHIIYIMYFQN